MGTTGLVAAVVSWPHRVDAESDAITQPPEPTVEAFLARAQEMKDLAIDSGDQGYGAVVIRDGVIVGQAPSRVVTNVDPTAHAETEAIRDAARRLGSRDLSGCVIYSTFRPCAMCEAAAYWARIDGMIHGASAQDAGRPQLRRC